MLIIGLTLAAEVESSVEARVIGTLYPEVALDEDGTTTGQRGVLETRARVGLDVNFNDRDAMHLEGDVLDSQLLGNPWVLGSADTRRRDDKGVLNASSYAPRRLSATTKVGPVSVEAGLQTSHWGLGLVANDGAHDSWFGRLDGGDTVLRLKLATMPLGSDTPLYLIVNADRVYADDLALWLDGQAAYQGSLALLWKSEVELGAYGVLRHQREADRRLRTTVGVVDVYGSVPLVHTDDRWIGLAWEAAGIFGQTSRAASPSSMEGLSVRSAGGLAQLQARQGAFSTGLGGGWTTGDGDPYDGVTNDFAADPNLNVGFVLFDEVMGSIDARAYQQLDDPSNIGQPPDGADTIVAEGAWRRSAYLQPMLGWSGPVHVWAGAVFAWNTAPYAQPFYSGRNGGNPTTHLNEDWSGSHRLGTELDWAVGWMNDTGVDVVVQGGYLLPGPALGMDDSVVMMHMAHLRVRR